MNDKRLTTRRQAIKLLGSAVVSVAFFQQGRSVFASPLPGGKAMANDKPGVPWIPGLQLYTLGLTPKDDLASVLKNVAAIGYREVELPGSYDRSVEQLRGAIDGAGLSCPSIHMVPRPAPGTWDLTGDLSKLASDVRALGARHAVVPIPLLPDRIYNVIMHPPAGFDMAAASRLFASLDADDWKRTADLLNKKGAALESHGVRLAYHNHGIDFHPLPNGTHGFAILMENTDPKFVDFELDVGWAVAANQALAPLFQKLGRRLRLLHLKDTKRLATSVMDLASTDMGTGIVDWQALAGMVRHSSIEHMFVEQETPFATTPMEAARVDYEFGSKLFSLAQGAQVPARQG